MVFLRFNDNEDDGVAGWLPRCFQLLFSRKLSTNHIWISSDSEMLNADSMRAACVVLRSEEWKINFINGNALDELMLIRRSHSRWYIPIVCLHFNFRCSSCDIFTEHWRSLVASKSMKSCDVEATVAILFSPLAKRSVFHVELVRTAKSKRIDIDWPLIFYILCFVLFFTWVK